MCRNVYFVRWIDPDMYDFADRKQIRYRGFIVIIYIKAIWVIDQVGLQVGLRALNDRVRMNFMCEKPTKAII